MMKRKGASSRDAIELSVLERLNSGTEESATLSEALAVDFGILLGNIFPDLPSDAHQQVNEASELGITKRMDIVAKVLRNHLGGRVFETLKQHPSDTVRGWAAFIIGREEHVPLTKKLVALHSLADDPHFGVREWAWLALRPTIALDVNLALAELEPWTQSASANIRRFAIEVTRPRGVWSKHIQELKDSPEIARPLLNNVMSDPAKYVQDSCGNWINDAAKTNPQWVIEFCRHWQGLSASPCTKYIIKRGLRNLTEPTP